MDCAENMKTGDSKRSATASDKEIGKRIRMRRTALNLSQTELGDKLGVVYQQVQKYEGGETRIAATRLADVAKALDVPLAFFLNEGVTQTTEGALAMRLQKAFARLDSKKKKELVRQAERIADDSK